MPGEHGAIADALITGERGGISAATNAAYRDSGLFHILSISGLHMTIMAGAVFLALRLALAAVPAIALRYPVKKMGGGFRDAGCARLSADFGRRVRDGARVGDDLDHVPRRAARPARARPAQRGGQRADHSVVLPDSLLDVGFQMSFAAVVALVAAFEALRDAAARHERRRSLPVQLLSGRCCSSARSC